jgi:exopolysaccharide biosynthesis polyprenyl glycosylphosphotransferase
LSVGRGSTSLMDDLVVVDAGGERSRSQPWRFVPRALGRRLALGLPEARASREVRHREVSYRRVLAVADVLAGAGVLALLVVIFAVAQFNVAMLLSLPFVVVVGKIFGLYDRDDLVLHKSTLDEAPTLLQVSGLFALVVWLVHDRLGASDLEGLQVIWLWTSMFAALFILRAIARDVTGRISPPERCLVVGDHGVIGSVARKLSTSSVNARVVAGLPVSERQPTLQQDAFREMVRQHAIERVIIAPVSTDAADTLELIRLVKALGVRVSLLPRLLEVVGSSVEFDNVEGLTMLGVRRFGLTRSSLLTKRAFDVVGATVGLIAIAPIFAAVVAAIRFESRGPVFFRQTRVGREGRHFQILKFRSMCVDAEARKADLLHLNETSGLFKIGDDPRITRVGRLLRRTSLDELPQLINVWRGDMSLVGPRPLVLDEDARVAGFDRARLALTPGMTGHWQILGSARIPMEEMVGIDYLYVANWTLWTDVKILLRTVPYMLARRGM